MFTFINHYQILILICLMGILTSCQSTKKLTTTSFYEYDRSLPLHVSVTPQHTETNNHQSFDVKFQSTHHQEVTGILSYPEAMDGPVPVIILMHGLGDRKEVDYVAGGAELLNNAGFAVLRLDLHNHGIRQTDKFDFSFEGETRYRTREVITQSVFDIRRAIDFIESQDRLDAERIGYFGISLGGVIGTVAAGIEDRIKVPVIVLAGGNINLMFGLSAFSGKHKNYLSVIDPINFVRRISPRPLLMINADEDEVIPPITSKFMYNKARKPKKIIWYEAKHRTIPVEKAYEEGINWFLNHLK